MIAENQEKNFALGTGVIISGFNDGLSRRCYPYTLETIDNLNIYLAMIDCEVLGNNFDNDDVHLSLITLFADSFRITDEKEFEKLLDSIDDDNYKEIISDIKKVNGIIDDVGEIDMKASKETMDWNVATSAILVYTSIPFEEIKKLPLVNFNNVMKMIGKEINWSYKTATIGLTKEPNDYIDREEHPLYSKPNRDHKKKHMTMEDAMAFMQG